MILWLSGCAAQQTFETVSDIYAPQTDLSEKTLIFDIPQEAAVLVAADREDRVYFCEGYEIMVQTMQSGDLSRTVRQITGYPQEKITLVQTELRTVDQYSLAWTAMTEEGDAIGRAVILDDGCYHYCLSVIASAEETWQLQQCWQELFDSVSLQG